MELLLGWLLRESERNENWVERVEENDERGVTRSRASLSAGLVIADQLSPHARAAAQKRVCLLFCGVRWKREGKIHGVRFKLLTHFPIAMQVNRTAINSSFELSKLDIVLMVIIHHLVSACP
jgi:hypothetical protein